METTICDFCEQESTVEIKCGECYKLIHYCEQCYDNNARKWCYKCLIGPKMSCISYTKY